MRIVTDGKLRRLVARLLRARADGQKVIVFSQFTDTLAYVDSVLRAAPRSRVRSGRSSRGCSAPTSGARFATRTCSPS
jgi:ERCC4-related helicase